MNETGPGDYNVPQFTGNKSVLAEKKTGPSFSFGTRAKKVQFISKEYLRVRVVFLMTCYRTFLEERARMQRCAI